MLFPGGMMTRHLESSVLARPADLGESLLDEADVDAMIAHQPMGDGDLVTPEHAIRNLLTDLEADEPYVLTHGSYRPHLRAAARRHRRRLRPHGGIMTDDTNGLQQLLDIEPIKQLKARYFRLMDRSSGTTGDSSSPPTA